ncbi:MAG: helix-turn-helix domain-containing protein [Oscillospiraceae bacterium]|nr:helix-turn-helix domain-containing protein [Oscillospiraceae bacterium]
MEFSERLIHLRKENGLSQEALGDKLNVARQTISKWELGETTPEMDKLIKISEIFDISLDALIKGAEPKSSEFTAPNNNTNTQKLAGFVIIIIKVIGLFIVASIILGIISIILFSVTRDNLDSRIEGEVLELENRLDIIGSEREEGYEIHTNANQFRGTIVEQSADGIIVIEPNEDEEIRNLGERIIVHAFTERPNRMNMIGLEVIVFHEGIVPLIYPPEIHAIDVEIVR